MQSGLHCHVPGVQCRPLRDWSIWGAWCPASWPLCFDGAAGSARPLDEGCRAGCGAVRPVICIRASWCCFPSLLWAGIKGRDLVLTLGASLGQAWCHRPPSYRVLPEFGCAQAAVRCWEWEVCLDQRDAVVLG